MKLDKLELSALLGMQARNRELVFMMEQIKLQIEQLDEESKELFSDIEVRLKLEPDTLINFDVDVSTGDLIEKKDGEDEQQGFGAAVSSPAQTISGRLKGRDASDITELEDVD